MADLTPEMKLAMIEFLESTEKKKDEKFIGLIKNWLGIIGVTGLAVLTAFWAFLSGQLHETARDAAVKEVGRISEKGSLDDRKKEAIDAVIKLRAATDASQIVVDDNISRSKELLVEISTNLSVAQQLKREFKSAEDIQKAVRLFSDSQQNFISSLKSDPELQKAIAGNIVLPKGLVAAFDRSEKEGACPKGWRVFEQAGGRLIVGAGQNENIDMNGAKLTDYPTLKDDAAKAVGGEEKHILATGELPPHIHKGKTGGGIPIEIYRVFNAVGFALAKNNVPGFGGDSTDFRQVDPASDPELPGPLHVHQVETDGGVGLEAKPHNTMPPFVALYYCIKQ